MKTIGVLVLLLLASVHVFTQVLSSDQQNSTTVPASNHTITPTTAAKTTAAAASTSTTSPAATSTTQKVSAAPTATATPTPKATATATSAARVSPPALPDATSKTPDTLEHESLDTRSNHSESGNHSKTPTNSEEREAAEKLNTGKGPTTPASEPHQTTAPAVTQTHPNENDKGVGRHAGIDEKFSPKADKRLWWIVLPALLVGAAAAIVLKFKCKKIHDHTETIDTGTENASFQSRPESTKDGVMLLGVKSSDGDRACQIDFCENVEH
ncbi:endochitinase A-like isoform X2 [Perca fluviatilis]|uniref:endochitinase A-like isoform X2 n=1 Tax=Perca fluviatilis TaxID=8168 RepID=UPI0019666FA3|nr:endochitinase A-like isoform X2 [Perca fluviatilis]